MTHDPFTHAGAGCEPIQRQLSELADSGAPMTPELQGHLEACAECAQFAERWLPGPPAELTRPVSTVPDIALRERILDAAAQPNVVRFPVSSATPPSWSTWLGRIAAGLALAGLAYWLLNPVASPLKPPDTAAVSSPTLTQSLTQIEGSTRHEQTAVQTALVDGGRQVRGDVAWSVSALEL